MLVNQAEVLACSGVAASPAAAAAAPDFGAAGASGGLPAGAPPA